MHYYSAKGLNYAVTPDHTMLYGQRKHGKPLDWRTQERQEIATWNNKFVKKVIDWGQPDDAELSDDWLTFLGWFGSRSEEHTSELQSRPHLVCRLLLDKKQP